MVDKIWRLMTAMFLLLTAAALGIFVLIMQDDFFAVIAFYAMLLLLPFGIAKGLMVIIDYHREHKDEETDEE